MSVVVRYTEQGAVGIITLDNPPINASSQTVREQLKAILDSVRAQPQGIRVLMLQGAGGSFMAGADIREFELDFIPLPDPNDIHDLLESMPVPVVAAMHGHVLGGGLEMALACHYRVAHSGTQFGLPEVKLGVLPGSGGTQRLPRLLGFPLAMELIVSGKSLPAGQALKLGLLDAEFDDDWQEQALEFCISVADKNASHPMLSRLPAVLSDKDKAGLSEKIDELPAADQGGYAMREAARCVLEAAQYDFATGLARERLAFLRCKETNESKALRHAFFAQREAARIPGLNTANLALRSISKVGVIGAGTMGTGIAMSFANAGIAVVLQDLNAQTLERAQQQIHHVYQGSVTKQRLTQAQALQRINAISLTLEDTQLADCDLIIEAVFENFDIKKAIFKRLGEVAKPTAILASNTSSLDVNVLAECSGRPADVLGMHFFSPAHIMRLLEVVRGDHTAPEVLATIMSLAKRIGKVAAVSGVCFGFIGNRMLEGYLRETEFLLLEGATPAFIDKALENFGMAMGPCRMIDMAGVDVAAKVVLEQKKAGQLGADEAYRVAVQRLFELGRHGQKSGLGYYRYEGRNAVEDPAVLEVFKALAKQHDIAQRKDITADEVVQRCLYPLIAEGYRILEEGIAYRAGDIDVVWLHGYGFPAYRGGPMFYAQTLGEQHIRAQMLELAASRGNRFAYWDVPPSLGV